MKISYLISDIWNVKTDIYRVDMVALMIETRIFTEDAINLTP